MPRSEIGFDTHSDAMVNWPKHDLINWVEWRVRAFEVARENLARGFGAEPPDHPLTERDLKLWLSKERDGQSLTQIARNEFAPYWKTNTGKRGNQRSISLVRNAVSRVDRFLNRGRVGFKYPKDWERQLDEHLRRFFGEA